MAYEQRELFAEASEEEISETEFYLKKYKTMVTFIIDFERYESDLVQVAIDGEVARRIDQEDLHADKTANAVVLAERQRWVYSQYCKFKIMIDRAHAQILDAEVKEVINIRFIQGYSRKETILFTRHGVAHSTVDRRINEGVITIANTLKVMGFFEKNEN